jgi:hypothetical protein
LEEKEIAIFNECGGLAIGLQYFSAEGYGKLFMGLKTCLKHYEIEEHFTELLYIIINKVEENEAIFERKQQEYSQYEASSQLANFLLIFKDKDPNSVFQITAKSNTKTAQVKESSLAKWMYQTIYTAVENKQFPMDEMGLRILNDLFGNDPFNAEEISDERLRKIATLKVYKPSYKPFLAELCHHLKHYLIEHTHFQIDEGKNMTDKLANFYFDVLELLGYVDREKVAVPKDYIYSTLNNYKHVK